MEDMPANLDDGELWIPSDIFPAEETHHHRHPMPGGRPHLEDLGRQFSDLNYLDRHRRILSLKARSISQGLEVSGPMKQYALTASSPNGCYGLKVGPAVDHGLSSTCNYDYEFDYPNTVPTAPSYPLRHLIHHHRQSAEYERLLIETRIGSTRGVQQGRHQSRLFPFQATGFGFGSFMKDCRTTGYGSGSTAGTGVFIPRATASHKFTTYDAGKRKLGHTQQRGASRKLMMDKAEEYYSYDLQFPPSDVSLPKDWSY